MAKMILRRLGLRGRTTIPEELRKQLDYCAGDLIGFIANDDDSITIQRIVLCNDEECPIRDESGPFVATPESVLDDFSDLTPAQQRNLLPVLVSMYQGMKYEDGGKHFGNQKRNAADNP